MNDAGPVLRDIHLPPAAWWPPAPGWWLLSGLLLLIAAGCAWWLWRRARRRPLRAALREIDILESFHARDSETARLVEAASRLLRRIARHIDPAAASWTGDAWRTFLHRYAKSATTRRALDELLGARFRAQPAVDVPALMTALRAWCRDALRGRAKSVDRLQMAIRGAASR